MWSVVGRALTVVSVVVLLASQAAAVAGATLPIAPGWQACEDRTGRAECTTLQVPVDRDDPATSTIALAVRRLPARDHGARVGTLVVIAGGPGQRGTDLVAEQMHSRAIIDRFDIVGWDPRGTSGASTIDCMPAWDPFPGLDRTPDDDAERLVLDERISQAAARCQERHGDLLPFVGTLEAAGDLEQLRRSLGEDHISILASSYGTRIALTYATLYPQRVRALVLDGLTDPELSPAEVVVEQASAFEGLLDDLLDACAADPGCELRGHGPPSAVLDDLLASLDGARLATSTPGVLLSQSDAFEAITGTMMGGAAARQALLIGLATAADGDGTPLRDLAEGVRRAYEASGLTLGTYAAISCADDGAFWASLGADAVADLSVRLESVAPRLGPWLWSSPRDPSLPALDLCAMTPSLPRHEPIRLDAAGIGHALVLGTSGDPTTPIEGARRAAERLPGATLVTLAADHHLAYHPALGAPDAVPNHCLLDAVERYLIDLDSPVTETCR